MAFANYFAVLKVLHQDELEMTHSRSREIRWSQFLKKLCVVLVNLSRNWQNGALQMVADIFKAHHQNKSELGYVLNTAQIWEIVQQVGNSWGSDSAREGSSVFGLISEKNMSLNEFMVGTNSLGALLQSEGFAAIPSPSVPTKEDSVADYPKFLRGGYITQTYGSRYNLSSNWDAIQVEAPGEVRNVGSSMRASYATGMGNAIAKFYHKYYILC